MSNRLDFLLTESKKIHNLLSEYYVNNNKFKEFISQDILILSSLCAMADGELSPNELIFISLVHILLNPDDSKESRALSTELQYYKIFPLHLKSNIINYWDRISDYIRKSNLSFKEKNLNSINYIKEYDKINGTKHFDKISLAYKNYSETIMKADGVVTEDEKKRLLLINQIIFQNETYPETKTANELDSEILLNEEEKAESLEEVMEKINDLIGMKKIKDEIKTFINLVKVQKEREKRKMPVSKASLHAVFYGPPGTGKTTIARYLGKVYKALGLLEKGHLIETDRAGLVAGYVGQTATKVDEVITSAMDGVLFIDEAYTLTSKSGTKDFGQEAIDTILKRMEDFRDRFAVIVAGYPDEMEDFINSNPGLKSRFSRYFYFDHYTPKELIKIFDIFIKKASFKVTRKATAKMLKLLKLCYKNKQKTFGNGRLVRNIFEKIIEIQANRIVDIVPLTDEILCTITDEDVPEKLDNISFEIDD